MAARILAAQGNVAGRLSRGSMLQEERGDLADIPICPSGERGAVEWGAEPQGERRQAVQAGIAPVGGT